MGDRAMDAELTGEPVARAAGDQAERGGRAAQLGGDLVHGAVTADRHDQLNPVGEGLPRQFAAVVRSFCGDDLRRVTGGKLADRLNGKPSPARSRIDDKAGFQSPTTKAGPGYRRRAETGCVPTKTSLVP